jgi:hypothetical protein
VPELSPKFLQQSIHFARPLPEGISEANVHYVTLAEQEANELEGAAIPPANEVLGIAGGECVPAGTKFTKAELQSKPKATAKNMCAYATTEEFLPAGDASFHGIVDAVGSGGTNIGGAAIAFEYSASEVANASRKVKAYGTWVVQE